MAFGAEGMNAVPIIACIVIGSIAAMIDTTPPSVSLEGKTIWLAQSLPVDPWLVLQAKLRMHLLLAVFPTLFCAVCLALFLAASPVQGILMVLLSLTLVFLYASFGLFVGVKLPNLSWTNETVPIKQSAAVLFALLGGMAWSIVCGGVFFLVKIQPTIYLTLEVLVNAAMGCVFYLWLRKKGARRFAGL